jgi:hypothetical protein
MPIPPPFQSVIVLDRLSGDTWALTPSWIRG